MRLARITAATILTPLFVGAVLFNPSLLLFPCCLLIVCGSLVGIMKAEETMNTPKAGDIGTEIEWIESEPLEVPSTAPATAPAEPEPVPV